MSMLDDEKQQLRKQAAKQRSLAQQANAHAADDIASFAEALISRYQPRIVAAYWPIRSEIDPIPLLSALSAQGAQTCLPVTPAEGLPLQFHHWQIGTALADGPYQTKQPFADAPVLVPDLILAPLLAFDKACWRLGYGGGFYDRTLERLRAKRATLAIGFAYSAQELDALPLETTDQALDMMVTEKGVHTFDELKSLSERE